MCLQSSSKPCGTGALNQQPPLDLEGWLPTQHVLQRDIVELRQVLRLQLLRLRQLIAHGWRGLRLSEFLSR